MLTDQQIKALKPQDKAYRVSDQKGLAVKVFPNGSKRFELRYRNPITKTSNTAGLGVYPKLSLKDARLKAEQLKSLLSNGVDINTHKKQEKLKRTLQNESTFSALFEQWVESNKKNCTTKYRAELLSWAKRYYYPLLADKPVSQITPFEIYQLSENMSKVAPHCAKRMSSRLASFFTNLCIKGLLVHNPATGISRELPPAKKTNFKSITKVTEFERVVRQIWECKGTLLPQTGLKLMVLLFQRPNEIVSMRWSDIDFQTGIWSFTMSKTKQIQRVPLPKIALDLIENLRPETGHTEFVFYNRAYKTHLHTQSLRLALRYQAKISPSESSVHGFRSSCKTLLQDKFNYDPAITERQLGHKVQGVAGHYDKSQYFDQRKEMLQTWADYIESIIK